MLTLMVVLVWMGGAGRVYDAMRIEGRGKARAAAEGAMWPIGLGQWLAGYALND